MEQNFSVESLLETFRKGLKLSWVGGAKANTRAFPALDSPYDFANLVGYFNPVRMPQVAIVGDAEFSYLQTLPRGSREQLQNRLKVLRPNCFIITDNQLVPPYLTRQTDWPLITSELTAEHVLTTLRTELPGKVCRRWVLHGSFVSVFGVGVLITGEENTGKSTLALELLERGHRLIADDAPEFGILEHNRVVGFAPAAIKNFLSTRELGVIDVPSTYGDFAMCPEHRLDILIRLESTDKVAKKESTLDQPQEVTILGQQFPQWTLNNSRQRSLSVLVESCAKRISQIKSPNSAAHSLAAQVSHTILKDFA
ncbi:MAG: hypothetical protein OEX00_05420 [Gammaproteobacteria bacterium]|nr:hypothetical protein [Gammaproteobacteria bacterium]MDH5692598.1 hypothetical protein [Gammaproteobacteria bacterium]